MASAVRPLNANRLAAASENVSTPHGVGLNESARRGSPNLEFAAAWFVKECVL